MMNWKLVVVACLCTLLLSGLACKLRAAGPGSLAAGTPIPTHSLTRPATTATATRSAVPQPSPTEPPAPTLSPTLTLVPTVGPSPDPTLVEPLLSDAPRYADGILPPPFPGHILSIDSTQPLCDDQMLKFRLASLGYLQPGSNAWNEDTFGPEMEAAVLAFEQANGLVEDGQVDWQEWGILFGAPTVTAGGSPGSALPTGQNPIIFRVGENPVALAFDGQRVWVAHASSSNRWGNSILSIDPVTGSIGVPILVGACPQDYETGENTIDDLIYAAGKLWVVMPGSSSYQAIDPLTGLVEPPVRYAGYPTVSGSLVSDGQRLWVSSLADIALRAFDLQSGELIHELTLYGGPGAMLLLDHELWVVNGASVSEVIDPERGEIVREVMAGGLSFSYDGSRLWFADGAWLIGIDPTALDPFASDSTYQIKTAGSSPVALAFDGTRLWVADAVDNTIQSMDRLTGELGDPVPVGNSPSALLFDGVRLWIVNSRDGTVEFIIP
jgi:DNA-binding beta-propeller fold protein YncE